MRFNTNQMNIDFHTNSTTETETEELTAGEFFAGGGGFTEGMEKVEGVKTRWILNHDKVAISTNAFHHPDVKVYWADIYAQDEHELEKVDIIHASIECTQHSIAKGGKMKKIGSYMMGWELYRYIKYLQPLVLTIENVPEFKKWAPLDENKEPIKERKGEEFERWKQAFKDLGYEYTESIRNAAYDGLPTRRVRYFGVFYRPGINFTFPQFTHSKSGTNGKFKWKACKEHLDLEDEGISIFGREFNEQLPKHLRRKLVHNSLRRIGYGAMKYSPAFKQYVLQSYGSDFKQNQSILDPLYTMPQVNNHQLIALEKAQFIADHCQSDNYQLLDEPLKPQTTRQNKQLVSVKSQFIYDYCRQDLSDSVDGPLRTQLGWQTKKLITVDHIICQYYGALNAQDVHTPLKSATTLDRHQLIRIEKVQFITKYMNSNGSPERNIESIEDPISPIMTEFKHQLITLLDGFDIKARFLRPDELAACSTFPRDYFNKPGLKVSGKDAVKMIGNAVPPDWAPVILGQNIEKIKKFKKNI